MKKQDNALHFIMEIKINLSLTRDEALSLLRLMDGDAQHHDWENINKMSEKLKESIGIKPWDFI